MIEEPCAMEEEKDLRFRRLSTIGAIINFVAVVFALTATVTYHWARLSGASYVAGAGAIMCTIFLAIGSVLGPLVVTMHYAQHAICLKFRHATFTRVIVSSGAAISSLIALICFLLEAKVFVKMQVNDSADLSWSFYVEGLAFVLSCVVGVIASVEWKWARKLGGDPTVYSRDPDGTKAETIENPNFLAGPRTVASKGGAANRNQSGAKMHRNSNGVAMTHISGLPYSVAATNGAKRGMNGQANGSGPRIIVAFDPKKTPLRSSMKRPKKAAPPSSEDTTDATVTAGVLQNPSFTPASPVLKKKVRIHTQSTAV